MAYVVFLVAYAEDEEQARQGMIPAKKFPRSEDELPDHRWDYAYFILTQAINDICCGNSDLRRAFQGYEI